MTNAPTSHIATHSWERWTCPTPQLTPPPSGTHYFVHAICRLIVILVMGHNARHSIKRGEKGPRNFGMGQPQPLALDDGMVEGRSSMDERIALPATDA